MKDDLQKKLADEFSFMYRRESLLEQKANGGIHDLYGAFGCAIGDGWYEVLHGLCSDITNTYKNAELPVDIVIDQVKEKFGYLRFYYHIEGEEHAIHAIDFLRHSSCIRFRPGVLEIHHEIANIVQMWEEKSKTVCEGCGKPGVLRMDLQRVLTLCDDCYLSLQDKLKRKRLIDKKEK